MGYRELIDDLQRMGEAKARQIWAEAEAAADRERQAAAARVVALREAYGLRRVAAEEAERRRIMVAARRRATLGILAAEKTLAETLFAMAQQSLARLREDRYAAAFAALATELPACAWETVRVNPADCGLAADHVPGAQVITDESISGGLAVATGEGSIRIDNTLEKRLARGWPELLPSLLQKVCEGA